MLWAAFRARIINDPHTKSLPMTSQVESQQALIAALQDPAAYPHPVCAVQTVQTHISTVLLTGEYAYKIKKPLDLGFLDFSTLARRKHFCEEELRLNRRLAPQLYLEVVGFAGSPTAPAIGGPGEPFEYAVKMRQFDQDQLLDRVLARGELDPAVLDEVARRMARFHAQAAVAGEDMPFGTPEAVLAPMTQNFEQLRPLLSDPARLDQLARLEAWTLARHAELAPLLAARKRDGFVRECHGDMHLGNIALLADGVAIFDGIEFNDYFRWIDVMSEIAFLTMDLDDRGAQALSRRVLNAYLEESGDYAGLALLRFYQVYRAMVRAKVSSIRLAQGGLAEEERARILKAYQGYADLAEQYTTMACPALLLTHGVSGSGKSTIAQALVEQLGAIRIRSDVERKRLFGLEALARTKSELDAGIYSAQASEQTYARLAELAETVVAAGFTVVVDATFLRREQREPFAALAAARHIPYAVLSLEADPELLRARVSARYGQGKDASEADLRVLEKQLAQAEPLGGDEPAVLICAEGPAPIEAIARLIGVH